MPAKSEANDKLSRRDGTPAKRRRDKDIMKLDFYGEKWMKSYARENLWRVTALNYDIGDLIQDGYMVATRVARHYPGMTEQKHFMALFMRAYSNHVHSLSRDSFQIKANTKAVDDIKDVLAKTPCLDADTAQFCAEIEGDVGKVIRGLLQADGKSFRAQYRRNFDGTRETRNERFCRLGGIKTTPGIEGRIRKYLKGV